MWDFASSFSGMVDERRHSSPALGGRGLVPTGARRGDSKRAEAPAHFSSEVCPQLVLNLARESVSVPPGSGPRAGLTNVLRKVRSCLAGRLHRSPGAVGHSSLQKVLLTEHRGNTDTMC